MRNSANFTLVDLTESTKNPEVSRKSKSKSIFGSLTKYDSEVFVRYYDDEIVEVVVYRTAAVVPVVTYDVTFIADDETVEVVEVEEGDTLKVEDFPEVPAKDGFNGAWDVEEDIKDIDEDKEVNAVYTAIEA